MTWVSLNHGHENPKPLFFSRPLGRVWCKTALTCNLVGRGDQGESLKLMFPKTLLFFVSYDNIGISRETTYETLLNTYLLPTHHTRFYFVTQKQICILIRKKGKCYGCRSLRPQSRPRLRPLRFTSPTVIKSTSYPSKVETETPSSGTPLGTVISARTPCPRV